MGMLSDVRVLDFSRLLPGPYCTMLLADLGAEVIRIENPRELEKQAKVFGWDRLDLAARRRLRENDMLARNKQSVVLDIGNPEAQDVLRGIAREVDVVVEDYRPGVLARLGLGYEVLRHERLVYCSLSLCGQTGPYRDKPGHDPVALSIAGVASRIGEDPEAPGFSGIPAADIVTGTHAAFGIMAALHERERSGQGQQIDVAMSDCSMMFLVNVLSRHPDPATIPPRGSRRADSGIWRTRDGLFVCTTDMEPQYWRRFCEAVGRPDFVPLQNSPSHRPEIRAALEAIFARRTQAEWLEILGEAGTQFAPVYEVAEALEDPHNRARGMVLDITASDGTPLRHLGMPLKFSRSESDHPAPGQPPGAATRAVLSRLGLDAARIEALSRAGAFGLTPDVQQS